MALDTTRVYTEVQRDGKEVLRFIKDKHYDSNTIEGRTGQRAAEVIGSRYDAVLVAAARLRELHNGSAPAVTVKYGPRTTVLQEIEQGHVGLEMLLKSKKSRLRREDNK